MRIESSEPPHPDEGDAAQGGHPRPIRLPPHWHRWFARQDERRLALLDEIVDERIERQVLSNLLRRLKHLVVVAFLGAAAVAHWFSDQAAWIAERLPVLRSLWTILKGES